MCLMCIHYYDSCSEPECYEMGKALYYENPKAFYDPPHYETRLGSRYFLQVPGVDPCEHIRANHGPECAVVKKQFHEASWSENGWWDYDTCSCYGSEEEGWEYD